MTNEPQQTLEELGTAFLERLRAEHDRAIAYAEQLATAIEAAERIMPNLTEASPLTMRMGVRSDLPSMEVSTGWTEPEPAFLPLPPDFVQPNDTGQVHPPVRTGGWARRLRDLTQYEALVQIAEDGEGIVRTSDARDILIQSGLTRSKPKNAYTNIHHLLSKSDDFEKIGEGVFRLKYASQTTGDFFDASIPKEDSGI